MAHAGRQDVFLVLASDGLWDELTNEQCAAVIAAMGATVGLPKSAARTLQFDGEGGAVDSPQEREAAAALDETVPGAQVISYLASLLSKAGIPKMERIVNLLLQQLELPLAFFLDQVQGLLFFL